MNTTTVLRSFFTSVFIAEDKMSVPAVPYCNYADMESTLVHPEQISKQTKYLHHHLLFLESPSQKGVYTRDGHGRIHTKKSYNNIEIITKAKLVKHHDVSKWCKVNVKD